MTSKSGYPIQDAKLQLANGYPLDFNQLAQLLHAVCVSESSKISQLELSEAIGIADRKAENISSLAIALGLVKKGSYRPTELGTLVRERDPFFDDLGTLWFLHYVISSDARYIVWNRIINSIIPKHSRFNREYIKTCFDDLKPYFTEKSLVKHVRQEIKSCLDAYTGQSFARLSYLRVEGEWYSLGYRQAIPHLVLAASIVHFRGDRRAGDTAISIPDLCTTPNSPGVVFQLPEDKLRLTLEELKTQVGISLESRADLDQIRISTDLSDVELMKRYYDSRR